MLPLVLALFSLFAFSATQSNDQARLAQGPFSSMHIILKKTIFRIKVMQVDVQVDAGTQKKLKAIAHGQSYSAPLESQLVKTALAASHAFVRMKFVRNIDYEKFLPEFLNGVVCVRNAGIINDEQFRHIHSDLPRLFAPISKYDIKKGDEFLYYIHPKSIRAVFRTQGGKVLVDHTYSGQGPRQTLLGSQFASCSDFREPLIRSLFDQKR